MSILLARFEIYNLFVSLRCLPVSLYSHPSKCMQNTDHTATRSISLNATIERHLNFACNIYFVDYLNFFVIS